MASVLRRLVLLLSLALLPAVLCGQEDPPVVKSVKFSEARASGGRDPWIEMAVTVTGGTNPDTTAANRQFTGPIRVRVSVGFQVPAATGGDSSFSFYRAEASYVAAEKGKDATVSFFLPPEIAKRDRLTREPFAWLVELEAAGRPVPGRRDNVSRSLNSPEVIASFRARVADLAVDNDGMLLPIYLTPFYGLEGGRGGEMPTFIRREGPAAVATPAEPAP